MPALLWVADDEVSVMVGVPVPESQKLVIL